MAVSSQSTAATGRPTSGKGAPGSLTGVEPSTADDDDPMAAETIAIQ